MSNSAKRHKKHHHRSYSDSDDETISSKASVEPYEEFSPTSSQRRPKQKKHKEHKHHKHHHHHHHNNNNKQRDVDRRPEVISLDDSTDSDDSDCIVVDPSIVGKIPPAPRLSKHTPKTDEPRAKERDYDTERMRERPKEHDSESARNRDRHHQEHDRSYERKLEQHEREKEREKERERERERARERERLQREAYIRSREAEHKRMREKELEQERMEREKERERIEAEKRAYEARKQRIREKEHPRQRSKSRSMSPIPEGGAGDVLSIEETNKLRAKLGLKPLEPNAQQTRVPEVSASKKSSNAERDLPAYKDEWGEFLHKPAINISETKHTEKLRERVALRKEKRALEERLARIRTLGESDEEIDDTSKWVERNKRIIDSRKEAELRAKALEELDSQFDEETISNNNLRAKEKVKASERAYNDKHLKGLRVDHDMDEFKEGRTVILTLKDKGVLDEVNDDTLVNVNIVDEERYRKNVTNKKLNPLNYGYNVYEEQYNEFGEVIERAVLKKYDEELGQEKNKNFIIGQDLEKERERKRKLLEIKTKLAGRRLETLEDGEVKLASDFLSEQELTKFKKPKKKIKKLRQRVKADDLLPYAEPSGSNLGNRTIRNTNSHNDKEESLPKDVPVVKDEEDQADLERILAKARRLKQKDGIITKPLNIDLESLKCEVKDEPTCAGQPETAIILNATAEFCRTLGDIPTYGMAGNRNEDTNNMLDFEMQESGDEFTDSKKDEQETVRHGKWNSVDPDEIMQPIDFDSIADEIEDRAILDEEPDVGAGVSNALRLALSKGYLEKEEKNRPSNSRMAHLQAKNYSIEDKNTADDDKFGGRRDRYHSGPISEFKDKNNYKPNVKIEYVDDSGHKIVEKEAFRYLSHKFHGKGPGKNKIEKRLKKMEREGLMRTMSSTDTPLGTLSMLQQKQKETKAPYVVLSGNSKNTPGTSLAKLK